MNVYILFVLMSRYYYRSRIILGGEGARDSRTRHDGIYNAAIVNAHYIFIEKVSIGAKIKTHQPRLILFIIYKTFSALRFMHCVREPIAISDRHDGCVMAK